MRTVPLPDSSSPKKILILTADAGFGHRSAATAVHDALVETFGDKVNVIVSNPLDDKRTPFFLRDIQSDYDKVIRNSPELYRMGYETSDGSIPAYLMEKTLLVLLYDVMRDIIKENGPDVILTTYPIYQSAVIAAMQLEKISIPFLTVITDLTTLHRIWFSKDVDKCLVSSDEARALALQYKVPEENIILTGIPVSPKLTKTTGSKEEIRKSLGWDPDKTTILAVGSKRVEHLDQVLNVINHSGFDLQVIAVAGKDKDLYEKLTQLEWHIPHQVYDFVKDMPTFMKASDAIISKAGGLIVTESLAAGLPMMLIEMIPGQETGNAEFVLAHGAGFTAENPLEIIEGIAHWFINDKALLKQQTANAKSCGHPNSAYQVAEILWESAHVVHGKTSRFTDEVRKNISELLERYRIPQPNDSIKVETDEN